MRIRLCLPSNSDRADDVTADADDSPADGVQGGSTGARRFAEAQKAMGETREIGRERTRE